MKLDATVNFRGFNYFLQRHSISILPDCKNVAFNTRKVNAQQSARSYHTANETYINNKWQMYQESVPSFEHTSLQANALLELYNMTKDTTEYLWYTSRFTLEGEESAVLHISSLGHALHAFVNGLYIGSRHGSKMEKWLEFQKTIQLISGLNHISLLGLMVGLPDSGAYMEHRVAGIHKVSIRGVKRGAVVDLSSNSWGYEVGLVGEKKGIYTRKQRNYVKWTSAKGGIPITWYKRYFDAPEGNDPIALDLSAMGKGLAWVNGECIGRYWVSYLSPLGKPSQSLYHVPRAFLKPTKNLIVLFEEHDGNPQNILITTVERNNICTFVSGQRDPAIKDVKPKARLRCPDEMVIEEILFASFGNPEGFCGNFTVGSCHAPRAKHIAAKRCTGKMFCELPVSAKAYGADASCPSTTGTIAVQAKCSKAINL